MDATLEVLKINVDKEDDGYTNGRKQVVKCLRRYKERGGDVELRRRNLIHEDDKKDDEEGETMPSTLQRFNEKLKKKEHERLQRMNSSFCEEDSEELEVFPPKEVYEHGGFTNEEEDDDSQENQSDVVLSFPSSHSSTEIQSTFNNRTQPNGPQTIQSARCISSEGIQTFSDAGDFEGDDICDEDSSYASMDLGNEVEMVNLIDENRVNASNSSYIDPVTGVRTSSYSAEHVPSLVTEKTAEWLVDDVGPRTAKRKRPAKQTKLPGSTEQRKRAPTSVRPVSRLNLSKSKPSRPKQTTLVVSKEPRTHQSAISAPDSSVNVISTPVIVRQDVVSTAPAGTSRINTPNSQHNVAPGGTPPMRLRVRVQDRLFLIPCPRQESKNIGWLAEQVDHKIIFSLTFLTLFSGRLLFIFLHFFN